MSRNFELMQQTGKAWDIGPVVVKDPKPFIPFPSTERVPEREDGRHGERAKVVPLPSPGLRPMDQVARDESFRLVQRLFLHSTTVPPRVVVFAGIDHGNGCSRICVEAAQALSTHAPGAVCIVEANFRTPSLPDLFGTTNHCGLTNALLGNDPIRSFTKPVHKEGLWLLSAGALDARSHGLLNSDRLRLRFDELRGEFDYLLVDAPPLTRYSDALALGRVSDGLVIVLEAHSTRRDVALGITENIRAAQVPILGVVLNKRTFPIPEALYRAF